MNKLDATMIYWSIRSAQRVSGNILPETRWADLIVASSYFIYITLPNTYMIYLLMYH